MQEDAWWKIAIGAALALVGGVVRICSDGTITTGRMMIASLLISTFAGGLTAAFLHDMIEDPIYLGAVCSMGGYMGQVMLVLLEKKTRNIVSAMMK